MDDVDRRQTLWLQNRFQELAVRSQQRSGYVYTEFLTPAEQETLHGLRLISKVSLLGGYEAAERKIARFGDPAQLGYEEEPPIVCLVIRPVSAKFAEALTHRDFLGALMALGIRREVLGDIAVHDNCGYLFCLKSTERYIAEQLTEVRRTAVRCEPGAPPLEASALPDAREYVVSSERLDAVIAAVYDLSRGESQRLFAQAKVFVNSRPTEDVSRTLSPGETVSVRGFGRFLYEGLARETRKGRLRISARVF